MALYVNTNAGSINAQNQLNRTSSMLNVSYERLASGLRINSAKDDAAGLQISNRLEAQINGLEQGNRNANDGVSLAQTAEGAMEETTSMLQRMRTLSEQAANGSITDDDRVAIQREIDQLGQEINRIADDTTFAGTKLLSGEYQASFQVGADAAQTISFTMKSLTNSTGGQSDLGAGGFTLSGMAAVASVVSSGLSGGGFSGGLTGISVTSQGNALKMLADVDKLIAVVDSKRAELGAVQNRFESTIRNQSNIIENLSESQARIRDTDFASETAKLTKTQTLQQAATSVLSQANQAPNVALSLLG